ncbi:hypothetical protein CU098_010058, partial [Rhizopus stolonifer]
MQPNSSPSELDVNNNNPTPREAIHHLLQRITDPELKKAIHSELIRLVSDHDRMVNILQQRTDILEQECAQLQSIEENYQRRYEKAVREMQFFKKKYDKATERQPRPQSEKITQSRKASLSIESPVKAAGLHPSIIQQRKVDPIAFGGSDALWETIAK